MPIKYGRILALLRADVTGFGNPRAHQSPRALPYETWPGAEAVTIICWEGAAGLAWAWSVVAGLQIEASNNATAPATIAP